MQILFYGHPWQDVVNADPFQNLTLPPTVTYTADAYKLEHPAVVP